MKGKRKFLTAMTFLILSTSIVLYSIKAGIVFNGNDIANIILWIAIGVAIISGTMAVENISDAGGIKKFFKGEPKADDK